MKKKEHRQFLNYVSDIVILLVEVSMFAFAWYVYYSPLIAEFGRGFNVRGNYVLIGLYLLLAFFFTKNFGGYRMGMSKNNELLISNLLAIFATNFGGYIMILLVGRRYMEIGVWPLLLLIVFQALFVIIWLKLFGVLYNKKYPARQALLIYGNYSPDSFISKIEDRNDKFIICETLDSEVALESLKKQMLSRQLIILYGVPSQKRNELIKYAYSKDLLIYTTPTVSDILISSSERIHLFDTPLLCHKTHVMTLSERVIKRVLDIVVASIALIISSPLFIILSVIIKLNDGGRVFFLQERYTALKKVFTIIKFRSMEEKSEEKWTEKNQDSNPKVTKIGNVMRRTHIDELPQFINILRGEMSLVGPRAEWKDVADEYEKEFPEFRFRYKVKAGLTGYAQVYGKYDTTAFNKLKLDLYYIENYSIWLDLKLILLTLKVLFLKDETQGIRKKNND